MITKTFWAPVRRNVCGSEFTFEFEHYSTRGQAEARAANPPEVGWAASWPIVRVAKFELREIEDG